MRQSLYLAFRYLSFYRFRSLVLVSAIGLIIFLPIGLEKLITDSEQEMMARAESFPLIIGAKGSSTDLVINAIYFEQQELEPLNLAIGNSLTRPIWAILFLYWPYSKLVIFQLLALVLTTSALETWS